MKVDSGAVSEKSSSSVTEEGSDTRITVIVIIVKDNVSKFVSGWHLQSKKSLGHDQLLGSDLENRLQVSWNNSKRWDYCLTRIIKKMKFCVKVTTVFPLMKAPWSAAVKMPQNLDRNNKERDRRKREARSLGFKIFCFYLEKKEKPSLYY